MRKNDFAIIMAGGIGSRFWPMSRSSYPKQFHDILGLGESLIQMTYNRIKSFIPTENIFVITNEKYQPLVFEQLSGIRPQEVLLEPVGRNTAPCVAYGMFKIKNRNPEAGVLVAGSDYLIQNEEAFRHDAEVALDACREKNRIITLGIPPTHPNTGYGYIQLIEEEVGVPQEIYRVKTFTEKPKLEIAKTYLEVGDFLWNSGMFIFQLPTMLNAYREYLPDMHEIFQDIRSTYDTVQERSSIENVYSLCRSISVDNGIIEKVDNRFVIKASFDWSDLGTWGSVYDQLEKDELNNGIQGNAMVFESNNNIVRISDPNKLVVLKGLEDFIVVDTGDVLMICSREKEQEIKKIVQDVRKDHGDKFV